MKVPPLLESATNRPVYEVMGDRYTLLLGSSDTGGAFSMFEFYVPKGHGSPPHIHSREDESFYVLSGEVDFMIDGTTRRARAGDVVFGPRGVPHNFTGASTEPARMLCVTSPGGFESFFAAIGRIVRSASEPIRGPTEDDVKRLIARAPEFGLTLL